MTYPVVSFCYIFPMTQWEVWMEAIMIASVAVVAVGGWYSAVDLLSDLGIRIGKRNEAGMKNRCGVRPGRIPVQQRIKQMAGVNI